MSMLYESLLLAALLMAATLAFFGFAHEPASPATKPWYQLYLLLVSGAYFGWFWTHGGQTVAMKAWRVRVIDASGNPLTLRQALVRYVCALAFLGLAGIGIIWAFFDRDRQFLHDRLARTRIISVS